MSRGCLEGVWRVIGRCLGYLYYRMCECDVSEGQVGTGQVRIGQVRTAQVLTGLQVRSHIDTRIVAALTFLSFLKFGPSQPIS